MQCYLLLNQLPGYRHYEERATDVILNSEGNVFYITLILCNEKLIAFTIVRPDWLDWLLLITQFSPILQKCMRLQTSTEKLLELLFDYLI